METYRGNNVKRIIIHGNDFTCCSSSAGPLFFVCCFFFLGGGEEGVGNVPSPVTLSLFVLRNSFVKNQSIDSKNVKN